VALDRQRVPDCAPWVDYYAPSRLERLAKELEAEPWEIRDFIHELVQRRLRERGDAWMKLDETLDARERRNGNGR
jgi:hypothetical protein